MLAQTRPDKAQPAPDCTFCLPQSPMRVQFGRGCQCCSFVGRRHPRLGIALARCAPSRRRLSSPGRASAGREARSSLRPHELIDVVKQHELGPSVTGTPASPAVAVLLRTAEPATSATYIRLSHGENSSIARACPRGEGPGEYCLDAWLSRRRLAYVYPRVAVAPYGTYDHRSGVCAAGRSRLHSHRR